MEGFKIRGQEQEPGTTKPPVLISPLKNLKIKKIEDLGNETKNVKNDETYCVERPTEAPQKMGFTKCENSSHEAENTCNERGKESPMGKKLGRHVQSTRGKLENVCDHRTAETP